MRAVVTEAVGAMTMRERPEPDGPMLTRLISHEFPPAQAPDALRFAISNPNEVMKVVIRDE